MSTIIDFPTQGTIGTSLKPKRYDIELYQGDTFMFTMTLKNGSTPINITGWTPLAQIRKVSDETLGETPALDATVPTGTDGVVLIGLSNTETGALDGDTEYKYDIQLEDASGNIRTFIGGKITITADITEEP